ncbi:MAG: 50S ribosomal protein L10 [Syntrophobacterales bacterium]|nr:50S ribosomal protein L10 [Syntrophobacterales bacterium]HRT28117.1 50S ribosomal protein L10 [Syntrophales bacterium]
MDRKTKEAMVAELHEKLKDVKLAVLADYSGMTVAKMEALRSGLRKTGAEMRVIKNTLLRIASKDTDFAALDRYLTGPVAVILNYGDIVESTKVLVDFAKKNAELEVKAGFMGGDVLSREQINTLAELPSREVLLGKLLSVMVAAQTGLVRVLSGVPRSLVQVLDAYRMKMV